jgi:AcrR family transcriptional regulator
VKDRPARGLRADAKRNRERVLEVAQEVFASEGLAVRMEEIARRAGVGVGTIYRHFPTKEALFEAIVLDRIERAAVRAELLKDAQDAGAAFFAVIEQLLADGAAKKDLVDALGESIGTTEAGQATKHRFHVAVDHLLSRAQAARAVRRDVDVADVLALVRGILTDKDVTAEALQRRAAVLLAGLRAASAGER